MYLINGDAYLLIKHGNPKDENKLRYIAFFENERRIGKMSLNGGEGGEKSAEIADSRDLRVAPLLQAFQK